MIRVFIATIVLTTLASVSHGDKGVQFEHHFGDREIQDDALGQTALVDLDRDGDLGGTKGKEQKVSRKAPG